MKSVRFRLLDYDIPLKKICIAKKTLAHVVSLYSWFVLESNMHSVYRAQILQLNILLPSKGKEQNCILTPQTNSFHKS